MTSQNRYVQFVAVSKILGSFSLHSRIQEQVMIWFDSNVENRSYWPTHVDDISLCFQKLSQPRCLFCLFRLFRSIGYFVKKIKISLLANKSINQKTIGPGNRANARGRLSARTGSSLCFRSWSWYVENWYTLGLMVWKSEDTQLFGEGYQAIRKQCNCFSAHVIVTEGYRRL